MKIFLRYLAVLWVINCNAQFDYLNAYIPYDSCNTTTHPILEIKTWVHIIQKSKNDPQNITKDSLHYLNNQFLWINQMYKNLKPPSRKNNNNELPYVKDSRIRFIIDTITFHVDENGWDRMATVPVTQTQRWINILHINSDSSTVLIEGVRDRYPPLLDSIIIFKSVFNNGVFHTKKAIRDGNNTLIYLKESISISEDSTGYVSYFKKVDKNCHKDNWIKHAKEDKNYLHVFYTGASKKGPAFGCGPSPYFLNVSKVISNGGYATAQLTAHELGHCLGLRHTNTPQFNDLPKSDKFGWINCNNTNTSNNIMGYNLCRNYLSPLQIAYIHYRYSTVNELCNTTENSNVCSKKINIRKNTKWDKSFISCGDIIVKKNKQLVITKKVTMPAGACIILEKKAKLIVDGGKILSTKNNWEGIVKCKSVYARKKTPKLKRNIPTVEMKNNGEIIY